MKVVKLSDREGRFGLIRRGDKTARVVPLVDGSQIIRINSSTIIVTGEIVAAPKDLVEIPLLPKVVRKEAAPSLEGIDLTKWAILLEETTSDFWICEISTDSGERQEFFSREELTQFVLQKFQIDVASLKRFWFEFQNKIIVVGGLDEVFDCLRSDHNSNAVSDGQSKAGLDG